jgi:hypothetical protein
VEVEKFTDAIAALVAQLDELRAGRSEQARIASVAITQLQTAELWGVKALTWRGE